ncbi:MAG: SLC13 family permease [Alphaproteobacteria bacterium]|nr:SLC13 family permease [Alphaproteobacteria bacterium]
MDQFLSITATSPLHLWATFAIISATIVAFALDRYSIDIVSAASLSALLLLFALFPMATPDGSFGHQQLLSGFASPALFAIMGLLIIGQGMFQSGALEYPTERLLRQYDKRPRTTIAAVFLLVVLMSAFLNNTPVVVMFIPIIAAMATQSKISPSQLMMPLSFLSIFGGMTTVIGSSTNMLAVQSYRSTVPGGDIAFFELTVPGGFLAIVGVIYMATVGRRLMPDHSDPGGSKRAVREGKQFVAQLEIRRGNPLIGATPVAGFFPDLPDVTVRMIQRRTEAILPPYDDVKLAPGDILIVAATRAALTNVLKSRPELLDGAATEIPLNEDEDGPKPRAQLTLAEAIVAPGSRMIGRTIGQIGFHYQTRCVILGVERRSRMMRAQMNTLRLEAGDVLLILGDINDVRALRSERDILMLEGSIEGLPDPRNARICTATFLAVVAAAATGVAPIDVSAIAGACIIVATGCLNVRQAARAVDRRIYLLIGASLAMGSALETTGGAGLIGEAVALGAKDLGPVFMISAFFIVCAAITNVLSNNATAVLFAPIAVSAAEAAGIDPHILILTVIFGANCSFATPVAYQTNLLVLTPGQYAFRDFIRVGGPLIIVLWIAFTAFAPIYFRSRGLM